jgi:hypothetical protein
VATARDQSDPGEGGSLAMGETQATTVEVALLFVHLFALF